MKLTRATCLLTASLLPLSTLWLSAADGPNSAPQTPAQAAAQESAKRQKLLAAANQAIADGRLLLSAKKYDDAAARFQFAVDSLTAGGADSTSYNRAAAGLAAAKAGQAQELAADAKFAQAAQLLQQAIMLQPNDPAYPKAIEDLKQQQIAYQKQVDDPEGTTHNPAVTPEFKDRVATVQKLLFQGDAYFRTGQYEKAEDTYTKILILDPYNNAARKRMDRVEKYRMRAAGIRHEEYEQERYGDVDRDWVEKISPDIVVPPKPQGGGGPVMANRAIIANKLNSIVIDKVNFEKLDIGTVIQFLQDKSKELDPEHKGINFVLRLNLNTPVAPDAAPAPVPGGLPPASGGGAAPAPAAAPANPIHREVSITLSDVPLSELLNYITNQTNLQYSIEDYAVYLRPSVDEGETLTVRVFPVPANFFTGSGLRVNLAAPTDSGVTTVNNVTTDVKNELISRGIRFPEGATATFLPGSSKLVVRDTPEQLDLISNLIDNLSKEKPQVTIEAKIAEFNQNALKGLSFNYTVTSEGVNVATGLRTPNTIGSQANDPNAGIVPNSLDELIADNVNGGVLPVDPITGASTPPNTPTQLVVGAVISGAQMTAVIDAINNTTGASLLSAPTVTTQDGLKANIDIVQEFPYPTTFEKPKLSNAAIAYPSGPGQGLPLTMAIPPTPREFVTQDVGVSLEVKPTTYPDKRIDLDISKAQVIDFDGFINYGQPIVELAALNQSPEPLTEGIINQPVFNLRSLTTTLQVLDGQTAVLGGLIREDTQEINDKIPVLGDLPLVGRLFQSKISQRVKKNLLFFITARLIRSNGKPQYIKTLQAEPEETLPEPDMQIGPGVTLPPLPEGTPNS